ncbi:phosphoribosylformylglycinamidine cyclo-ligase, partial [Parabacteroides sp. OttesenSCG-928-G21]|nr:phosphoribosylformylglycinamidine cyclo-ligase [Parabacteroides sp. OttesenSCG-928-G21]
QLRPVIHGMIHCSGGAQTKVMHFVENKRVIKNNMFPVPPLFRIIQEQSNTAWQEMYKVFNMGHRMEIYIAPEYANQVIEISQSFGVDAQVVGYVENADKNELIIESEKGRFVYE